VAEIAEFWGRRGGWCGQPFGEFFAASCAGPRATALSVTSPPTLCNQQHFQTKKRSCGL